MTEEIKIHIRKPCAACGGTGMVPASKRTWDDLPRFFDHSYCPCCEGEGYFEVWVGLGEFRELLNHG
jgi:DnaJ-class molecular chaperone